MAKKAKIVYVCNECGYESPKWMGQCICGAWNSMFEQKVSEEAVDDRRRRGGAASGAADGKRAKAIPLRSVDAAPHKDRIDTGIAEFNRVLGGGLVAILSLASGWAFDILTRRMLKYKYV